MQQDLSTYPRVLFPKRIQFRPSQLNVCRYVHSIRAYYYIKYIKVKTYINL